MADIATRDELASALQCDLDTETANLLLAIAQGLVVERIGTVDPWPASARSAVLAAAGRAYENFVGTRTTTAGRETITYAEARAGVFLTDAEETDLTRWLAARSAGSGFGFGSIHLAVPRP